jgi:hypothetical protein
MDMGRGDSALIHTLLTSGLHQRLWWWVARCTHRPVTNKHAHTGPYENFNLLLLLFCTMSSLLKAQSVNAAKAGKDVKGKGKRTAEDDVAEVTEPPRKKNKQRVLLLSSRGVTHRMRHLMADLEALLPHVKKGECSIIHRGRHADIRIDAKLDSKNHLHLLPELADLHNCNNTLYFEARRHEDLYLWATKTPNGPSIKMHVQNVHTMDELKMTGNCLKGSRGLLSFDPGFDEGDHWKLMKEVFTQVSMNASPCVGFLNRSRFLAFLPQPAEQNRS